MILVPPLEERGGGWGWGDFVPHNIGRCCIIESIKELEQLEKGDEL
ncbi:MAG: hypothetical protein ACKO87_11390 [Dolichospermum sp.]